MSDGGKENEKDSEQQIIKKPAGNEDFVRAIAKIAVAQICEYEGFQSFQQSALEALADVAVRYIKELGKTSKHCANVAGRSECNVFDVIQGLEDLGSIQGFSGASDIHHSLVKSGTIREISHYVSIVERIPFVFSLPRFPISREHKLAPSFCQIVEDPPVEHIPPWLPAFPQLKSHVDSPGFRERETDVRRARVEEEQELELQKKKEMNFMNAQQQQQLTANNVSGAVLDLHHPGDWSKSRRNGDINPFLAPPLRYEEKQVSSVEPPCRLLVGDHATIMERFTPFTETAQNEVCEIEERNKDIRLDDRPPVQLKFNTVRKSNLVARKNGDEKLAIFFGRDDENDEMEKRAEQILKESMETH